MCVFYNKFTSGSGVGAHNFALRNKLIRFASSHRCVYPPQNACDRVIRRI